MTEKIGRYEILEQVGQGGFAVVHRARDTQLQRQVALKELRPLLLNDTNWVRRFQREARAIARLDHPAIVPIYDVYEAEERLFLVMRLVNGWPLDELIARQGRLSRTETLDILATVAGGLDYAHSQGILHRDLKPANILVDADRGPMLTDFGLAKLAGENSMSLSANGSIVGTPHYIAPEVWEGKGSRPQSDVYALGCVLCEMLTGEKIFKGTTAPVVMMAHFQPLDLPKSWPGDVPTGIAAVMKKALANDPAKRYATAGEMVAALKQLSTGRQPDPKIPKALNQKPVKPPDVKISSRGTGKQQPDVQQAKDRLKEPSVPSRDTDFPWKTAGMPSIFRGDDSLFGEESEEHNERNPWRGFLAHLGPYFIFVCGLGGINIATGGNTPWFLYPAIAWGIGIAFHFQDTLFKTILRVGGKWEKMMRHMGAYITIIGALALINGITGGDSPWFLYPAMGWGIGLAIHFWFTLIGKEEPWSRHSKRRAERKQRVRNRVRKKFNLSLDTEDHSPSQRKTTNPAIQAHLAKARAYKEQISSLVRAAPNAQIQPHLNELAHQVDDWTKAIEKLAKRVNNFQQNELIHHDLQTVPASIKKLEGQLAAETDPATRAELKRTLTNRKNQLDTLQQLESTMKRAELKIENTLSLLGTIYPQILTSQSTNQVSDYSRISARVNEEMRALQDHLEALEELKFGGAGHS